MKLSTKLTIVILFIGSVFFLSGWIFGSLNEKYKKEVSVDTTQIWTCSMHPEVQLPKPGKCPKCAMDLIPLDKSKQSNKPVYEMTPLAEKLAEVEVSEVTSMILEHKIPLVGKTHYDERTTSSLSAWFPGRIDRLFVDFTGISVRKGEHLVEIYSPELLTAQEELIEAFKASQDNSSSDFLRKRNESLFESAKEKLRLWGLSAEQINGIAKNKKASDRMELLASQEGVVIHKMVNKGDYVKTGQKLFTIANLKHLWVFLDVYEAEMPFIYFGQEVELQSEAYPGIAFKGTVSFIQPELDDKTRTIRVRVNVANEDLRLKPGMLMNAMVTVMVGKNGQVTYPDFSHHFICPMHPEVIKEEKGVCDFCGMDLVSAKDLNLKKSESIEDALVIPESAVLITGKRAIVYLKKGNQYEGREITIGPKVGGYYIIVDGLSEGDLVVTKGNFKIDSSLQIMAKPSMMQREWVKDGSEKMPAFVTEKSKEQNVATLSELIKPYLLINTELAKDQFDSIGKYLNAWEQAVEKALVDESINVKNKKYLKEIKEDFLIHKNHLKDIESFRTHWKKPSALMVLLMKNSINPLPKNLKISYCSMAEGKWLQTEDALRNPYYGSEMLECGEFEGELKGIDQGENHER